MKNRPVASAKLPSKAVRGATCRAGNAANFQPQEPPPAGATARSSSQWPSLIRAGAIAMHPTRASQARAFTVTVGPFTNAMCVMLLATI
jgi:hypothetical protein